MGLLPLVILLDSPAFALKLTTISTSAFYEDNVDDNPDNIFPWDARKSNLTPEEGGYPESIPFRWFITARNDNNFDVILKKVSFQLFSDGGPPLVQLRKVGRPFHLTPPPIKVEKNQTVRNLPRFGSTTQHFTVAEIEPFDPSRARNLSLFVAEAHVTVQKHVPGPLPALGAAAAFSYSRKLRRSLKLKVDDAGSKKL